MKAENVKLQIDLNRLHEDHKIELDVLRDQHDHIVKSLQQQINDLKVRLRGAFFVDYRISCSHLKLLRWVDRAMTPLRYVLLTAMGAYFRRSISVKASSAVSLLLHSLSRSLPSTPEAELRCAPLST